jgi:hypothetical protein
LAWVPDFLRIKAPGWTLVSSNLHTVKKKEVKRDSPVVPPQPWLLHKRSTGESTDRERRRTETETFVGVDVNVVYSGKQKMTEGQLTRILINVGTKTLSLQI